MPPSPTIVAPLTPSRRLSSFGLTPDRSYAEPPHAAEASAPARLLDDA